jgi:hypothetical protein
MIEGFNYLTSYFVDNDRKTICVLLKSNEEEKLIEYIVEADIIQSDYKKLLTYTTLDAIHENTHNRIKAIKKEFSKNKEVLSIANVYKLLFGEFDEEKGSQNLFEFKLLAFEMPEVKNSTNREIKSKLRKAKNFREALIPLCVLLEESTSETTETQPSTDASD